MSTYTKYLLIVIDKLVQVEQKSQMFPLCAFQQKLSLVGIRTDFLIRLRGKEREGLLDAQVYPLQRKQQFLISISRCFNSSLVYCTSEGRDKAGLS